jgi:hypothetical protein
MSDILAQVIMSSYILYMYCTDDYTLRNEKQDMCIEIQTLNPKP